MKRLLIIEDEVNLQMGYKWGNLLEGSKLDLIQATTFADAERILQEEVLNKDIPSIDVISFDFNLDGANSSIKLINMINGRFDGIMLAASGNPEGRRIQMDLGCTVELESKAELINFVLSELNKNPE